VDECKPLCQTPQSLNFTHPTYGFVTTEFDGRVSTVDARCLVASEALGRAVQVDSVKTPVESAYGFSA